MWEMSQKFNFKFHGRFPNDVSFENPPMPSNVHNHTNESVISPSQVSHENYQIPNNKPFQEFNPPCITSYTIPFSQQQNTNLYPNTNNSGSRAPETYNSQSNPNMSQFLPFKCEVPPNYPNNQFSEQQSFNWQQSPYITGPSEDVNINQHPIHSFNNNFQQTHEHPNIFNQNMQPSNMSPAMPINFTGQPSIGQFHPVFSNDKSYNSQNVMLLPPCNFHIPPPPIPVVSQSNKTQANETPVAPKAVVSEKEARLDMFLKRFCTREKVTSQKSITLAEFRSYLQKSLALSKLLLVKREKLHSLLECPQEEWEAELVDVKQIKSQLSSACEFVSSSSNLNFVQKKLQLIKKKRELKWKLKQKASSERLKKEQEREAISQEIDKWLDTIKEKNLKEKREIEMKKEADSILSEVRKKILEGKKTLEKIKVLEKLRQVRQANAEQKGLFSSQDQNDLFEGKASYMRSLMQSQLADYEAEEKALQVMLETEQGGRREEEAEWRMRRAKATQEKRKREVVKCLFGDAEEPSPVHPLFLFFQHHNFANSSIDNLVTVRHQWDVHLDDNGEVIPQQWIVPAPASDSLWEEVCCKN